jgi:hypothetical protein
MTAVTLTLDLPDDIAKEISRENLLNTPALAELLRDFLAARHAVKAAIPVNPANDGEDLPPYLVKNGRFVSVKPAIEGYQVSREAMQSLIDEVGYL